MTLLNPYCIFVTRCIFIVLLKPSTTQDKWQSYHYFNFMNWVSYPKLWHNHWRDKTRSPISSHQNCSSFPSATSPVMGFCVKALHLKSSECLSGPFGSIPPLTTHTTLCSPCENLGWKFKGPLRATQQKLGCGCSNLTKDTGDFIKHVFDEPVWCSLHPSSAQHLWEYKRSTENGLSLYWSSSLYCRRKQHRYSGKNHKMVEDKR